MTGHASVPDLTPLLCLLNFSKKAALRILLSDVFECRFQGLTKSRREQVKNDLQLPTDSAVDECVEPNRADGVRFAQYDTGCTWHWLEMLNSEGLEDYHVDLSSVPSIQVVACLVGIMDAALYDSLSKEGVEKLFPADFHPALKGLLADVITTNLPNWREASLKSMVSLPKLIDVDWRVDVKTASSDARGVSEPVALIKLRVRGPNDWTWTIIRASLKPSWWL
eukprot:706373-Pyramimonas_sp.AAC.1